MKIIIGSGEMVPNGAEMLADYINKEGYAELYFLKTAPMERVRSFMRKLLNRLQKDRYCFVAFGVPEDRISEIAGIDEETDLYQYQPSEEAK